MLSFLFPKERILNAAGDGDLSTVRLLIESPGFLRKKVDINIGHEDGLTPLYIAAIYRQKDVVNYLIHYEEAAKTAMDLAVKNNVLYVLEQLVNTNTINLKYDEKGTTLLHKAIKEDNANITEFLVSRGADIYAKFEYKPGLFVNAIELAEHFGGFNDKSQSEQIKAFLQQCDEKLQNGEKIDTNRKVAPVRFKEKKLTEEEKQEQLVGKARVIWEDHQENTDPVKKLALFGQLLDVVKQCSYANSMILYKEMSHDMSKVYCSQLHKIIRNLREQKE